MSKNIDQVFITNPITSNASTDLMYFGQTPYAPGDDAAMTYANFSAQFGAPFTPAALTEVSDTNVVLTLGGTPATSLLQAASITASWSGTLSGVRGGTGVNNGASTITIGGSFAMSGAYTFAGTLTAATAVTFPTSGTLATTSQLPTLPLSSTNGGTGVSIPTIHGIMVSEGASPMTPLVLGAGQILIGTTAGDPAIAAINSGTGILVANATGSITISATGASPWVDETGAAVTMAANTGYTSDDGATLVTFTLPATAAIGDWVEINGKGAGGWTLIEGSGQSIHYGNQTTTTTTGSLSSSNQYDCARLRCLTANTVFTVVASQGNLTVV